MKVSGASKENKVLLILDGYKTHTQNLAVINTAPQPQAATTKCGFHEAIVYLLYPGGRVLVEAASW